MTLRRRIRTGELPAVHSGARLIRIPASALEQMFTPVPQRDLVGVVITCSGLRNSDAQIWGLQALIFVE